MTILAPAERYCIWKQWDPASFGALTPDERAYFDAEIAGQGLSILELGFGNGAFLAWCRERGHDCTGVDTNEHLVTLARNAGFAVHSSLDSAGGPYDLAVAFDVLEHIPQADLPATLSAIAARLKPAGLLLARFPNGDSPFGRLYQHGDPTHTTVLGAEKLSWLALSSGLRIERCSEPATPLRGAGILRMAKRLVAKALRRLVSRVICFAYYSGAKPVLAANLVVRLRRAGNQGPELPGP